MVASDRISAFDFVLSSPIPDKGRVLTAMTVWWFERLASLVPNHLISVDDPLIPSEWRGRAVICTPPRVGAGGAVAPGHPTRPGPPLFPPNGAGGGGAPPARPG